MTLRTTMTAQGSSKYFWDKFHSQEHQPTSRKQDFLGIVKTYLIFTLVNGTQGVLCYFPALYTHLLELVPDLTTHLGDGSSESVTTINTTFNCILSRAAHGPQFHCVASLLRLGQAKPDKLYQAI